MRRTLPVQSRNASESSVRDRRIELRAAWSRIPRYTHEIRYRLREERGPRAGETARDETEETRRYKAVAIDRYRVPRTARTCRSFVSSYAAKEPEQNTPALPASSHSSPLPLLSSGIRSRSDFFAMHSPLESPVPPSPLSPAHLARRVPSCPNFYRAP